MRRMLLTVAYDGTDFHGYAYQDGVRTVEGALAEAVKQIFSEKVIALVYADNARKRALITHDPQENRKALLAVYRAMTGEGDA